MVGHVLRLHPCYFMKRIHKILHGHMPVYFKSKTKAECIFFFYPSWCLCVNEHPLQYCLNIKLTDPKPASILLAGSKVHILADTLQRIYLMSNI